ncbi:MAG: hypothetical protein WAT92_21125 [Saprospiraceae bacterium]
MFPKLTIESKNNFNDLGLLAESLIFYQVSNYLFDPGSFPTVISTLGYDNFIELSKSNQFEAKINCSALGGGNVKDNLFMISSFSSPNHTKESTIEKTIVTLFGESSDSNDKIQELNELIKLHEYKKDFIEILNSEISNQYNIIDTVSIISNNEFNSKNIQLNIEQTNEGFYNIESNVPNEFINDACFLICNGSGKVFNSELYESELISNDQIQNYPSRRIDRIVNKRNGTEKQFSNFHEFLFPYYRDINSTMNSGIHSVNEFMDLWRKSTEFKTWLKDEDPNVELLTNYIKEIEKDSFLNKLPLKTIKWLLFTGIGTAVAGDVGGVGGTAASIAVDFLDDLVLDGLIKKQFWKPNQFVKGDYEKFLKFELDE